MINKIKKFFRKYIEKIKLVYANMNTNQKLISSIVFLVIMIILVKVLSSVAIKERNGGIDYNNTNGKDISLTLSSITDDDLYVTLKNISDDVISKFLGNQYDKNKVISVNTIYKEILTSAYTESISKGKFNDIADAFINKINVIKQEYTELIPSNIVEHSDNYYLVKYKYEINEEEIELYIGIAVDTTRNIYYIWYIE